MSATNTLLASNWVEGHLANRPMLPSEMRVGTSGTRAKLPWARADLESPRPLLPWKHRTGNDWRSLRTA